MFIAMWYHLYNLKNVRNTHGGVLFLLKLKFHSAMGVCAWKTKVPGSSPAATYVQRLVLCSNSPANV